MGLFLFLGIWRYAIFLPSDSIDKIWYYNNEYLDYGTKKQNDKRAQRSYTSAKLMKSIKRYAKIGSSVLDYGCGCGGYGNYLMECGCQVYGYDVNEESLEYAVSTGYQRHKNGILYNMIKDWFVFKRQKLFCLAHSGC